VQIGVERLHRAVRLPTGGLDRQHKAMYVENSSRSAGWKQAA